MNAAAFASETLPPSLKLRRTAEALSAFAKRCGETSTKLEERSRGGGWSVSRAEARDENV
jgi:hypothetical protein